MDVEQILQGSRWELLQQLVRAPHSTSQLAKLLGTSQANVSQQLRQLELAGFVRRRRAEEAHVHFVYEIARDLTYIIRVGTDGAHKRLIEHHPLEQFLTSALLHPHAIPLLTFFLGQPELFARFSAVGVLDRPSPELFVLADDVDDIRRDYANITLRTLRGEERIVLWSHTPTEARDGLRKGDTYFATALKEITLRYDPHGTLAALQAPPEQTQ